MRASNPFLVLLFAALCACSVSHAETTQREPAARPAFAGARLVAHPWTARDRERLTGALGADFANASVNGVSAVAVVADDGHAIYELRGARPMTPASTMKLFVGSTAFFTLGADHRLVTEFLSVGPPGPGGAVDDLWLVGGGDPVLLSDDLVRGVGALRKAGVRAIRTLNIDASAFDGPEQNPGWLRDDDTYDYAAGTSALSLDWNVVKTVVGGAQVYRPVVHIPAYVGATVRGMLKQAGIAIDRVRMETAPLAATTLWEHPSPTVAELVHQMFRESDNHIAEQLLRSLGAEDTVGSDAAGARAERAFLSALGISAPEVRVVDGSGLAPGDRTSSLTLASLLARVAGLEKGADFVRTLPRAGLEGTVRFHQLTDAAGLVRAKSGHIEGVNALAGYVQTRHHGRVAFAFIVNRAGLDDEAVERTYDLALDQISEF